MHLHWLCDSRLILFFFSFSPNKINGHFYLIPLESHIPSFMYYLNQISGVSSIFLLQPALSSSNILVKYQLLGTDTQP